MSRIRKPATKSPPGIQRSSTGRGAAAAASLADAAGGEAAAPMPGGVSTVSLTGRPVPGGVPEGAQPQAERTTLGAIRLGPEPQRPLPRPLVMGEVHLAPGPGREGVFEQRGAVHPFDAEVHRRQLPSALCGVFADEPPLQVQRAPGGKPGELQYQATRPAGRRQPDAARGGEVELVPPLEDAEGGAAGASESFAGPAAGDA